MKSLFGKQNSGCQLFGGTIFLSKFLRLGRILFIYSNGSRYSTLQSENTVDTANVFQPLDAFSWFVSRAHRRAFETLKAPFPVETALLAPNISFVVSEEGVGGFNFGGSPEIPRYSLRSTCSRSLSSVCCSSSSRLVFVPTLARPCVFYPRSRKLDSIVSLAQMMMMMPPSEAPWHPPRCHRRRRFVATTHATALIAFARLS